MTQETVRDIAAANPAAVRVFEKYGIDYCCGGHRPLAEVCTERGIAADTVLAEVEAGGGRVVQKGQARPEIQGYSGYFADPDGFLWEVAYNPHFPHV